MAGKSKGVPPAPGGAGWNNFDKKPGAAAGANRDGGAPSQIKCAICKKLKSKGEFSNRQLLKFTSYSNGGRTTKKDVGSVHATCNQCTAGQTFELKCIVCDKVKGLTEFAKNQRKDPDNARCTKCVNSDIKVEPELRRDSDKGESSSDDEEEDQPEWDAGKSGPTANKIRPYTTQNKKIDWATAVDEEDDEEFEDASSSATSGYGGPPKQQGYYPSAQRAPPAFNSRANQPSNSYAGRAPPPADDDEDEWETMDKTRTNGGSSRASSTASPSGYSSQKPVMRKGGWAKVSKADVQGEENPWASYGRK